MTIEFHRFRRLRNTGFSLCRARNRQKLRIAPRAPLASISIDLPGSGFYHFQEEIFFPPSKRSKAALLALGIKRHAGRA
jgi:hypothetical protein